MISRFAVPALILLCAAYAPPAAAPEVLAPTQRQKVLAARGVQGPVAGVRDVRTIPTSTAFELDYPDIVESGNAVELWVNTHEPVREIYASLAGQPVARVDFFYDPLVERYVGEFPTKTVTARATHRIRVVVRDVAGKRFEREVRVVLTPPGKCDECIEVPGC